MAQIDIETIEEIPVKHTNVKNQESVAKHVSKIIELKNKLSKHDDIKISQKINEIENLIEKKINEIYEFDEN